MTNTVATLGVDITVTERNPRALDAFEDKLKSLDAAGAKASTSLSESLLRSADGAKLAAKDVLALAQAQARGQASAGDYAAAQRTLSDALAAYVQNADKSASGILRVMAAEQQLANISRQSASALAREAAETEKLAQARAKAAQSANARGQADAAKNAAQVQRAADSALRLAQVQASGARAAGDNARATDVLTRAIAAYEKASSGGAASTIRLAQARNQLASAQRGDISTFAQLKESLSGVSTVAQSLPGPLGAVTSGFAALGAAGAAVAIGSFVADAGRAALELERIDNVARATAGSQERYNELIKTAREQQQLFGGSLQENISNLTGLASTARTAGADLADIASLAQRLATLDPSAGLEGATVALREAFSGNPASLAARFELPRAALAGLRDESATTADRIAILDGVLTQAGISAELISSSVPPGTRALNALGAAFDDLKVKIGGIFAEVPTLFGNIILAVQDAQTAVQNIDITPQTDYTAYLAQIDAVRAKIEATFANDPAARAYALQQAAIQALTPAQYAYAQALVAQGVAQEQATHAAYASTGAMETFAQLMGTARNQGVEFVDQLAQLQPAFLAASAGSAENAAQAAMLIREWQAGELTFPQVAAAIQDLANANLQQAGASAQAESAARAKADADAQEANAAALAAEQSANAAAALIEETNAKLESALAAQNLAAFQATLANLSSGVSSGFYSNEQAARILAQSYNIAYNEALKLIAAQAKLGQSDGRVAGIKGPASGGGPNGFGVTASTEQVKKIQEAKKAKRDYEKATGDAATKQRILNEEVRIAEQRYGQYSQEAYRARQASEQNRQAMEREAAAAAKKNAKGSGGKGGGGGKAKAKGGAAGGSTKLTDQQKLNNQIAADQQKADDAAEKAEREHRRRMTDIFKEYAEKMKQAERSLADAMYESRASFYRKVIDLKDADLQQKASAEYEAAVQNAAQIEKEQGADVAEAYLAEQEKIIAARAQREQEIRDLEKEGDTARAEALRGVDALERQAEDRRIARILEGQNSLKEQQQAALSEEVANYTTKQDEMSTAADNAANRRVAAAQRAGKEIDAERVKVEQLEKAYAKATASGRPSVSANNPPPVDPATVTPPTAATGDASTADADWRQRVLDGLDRIERAERDGARQVSSAVANRQVV